MKVHRQLLTNGMAIVLAVVFCGVPEFVQAQQQMPPNGQQTPSGVIVDPSKGPLQPVPQQDQGNASAPNQEISPAPNAATPPPQPRPEQQMQEPLGAATAEGVPTVGGGASRPAGAAIAPEKQKQRRALLLKMGAIAAAGIAAGTIYGISKGTPSKPGTTK
jgi:hypothetical protein